MTCVNKKRALWYTVGVVFLAGLASSAGALFKLGFHGGDGRLTFASGDWAPQQNKGECGGNNHKNMVAVAKSTNNTFTDAILCHNVLPSTWAVDEVNGFTLTGLRFGSNRRDTGTGDWAPGYIKAECGRGEIMTGLAQTTNPNAALDRAGCANLLHPTAHADIATCDVQTFSTSDDGGVWGDWDRGYHKGGCNQGQIIKGVAMPNTGGGPNAVHKILCCTYVP